MCPAPKAAKKVQELGLVESKVDVLKEYAL